MLEVVVVVVVVLVEQGEGGRGYKVEATHNASPRKGDLDQETDGSALNGKTFGSGHGHRDHRTSWARCVGDRQQ